jgi:hypothetical protein
VVIVRSATGDYYRIVVMAVSISDHSASKCSTGLYVYGLTTNVAVGVTARATAGVSVRVAARAAAKAATRVAARAAVRVD